MPTMTPTLAIPVAGGDTGAPRNLEKRLALIARLLPPKARVLDAGCGAGAYVQALHRAGYDVEGIEYQDEKVACWRSAHPGDARVQRGDIEHLPYPDGRFDAVLLNEVLEHIPDERAALRECWRVLRPGGRLLVFSPNRIHPFETHGVDSYQDGHRIAPAHTCGLPWLPTALTVRMVSPWARNYWPHQLTHLIRQAGFRVVFRTYVWQTFENISGRQGALLRALAPLLRMVSGLLERTPGLRLFGVSQVALAERAELKM